MQILILKSDEDKTPSGLKILIIQVKLTLRITINCIILIKLYEVNNIFNNIQGVTILLAERVIRRKYIQSVSINGINN